MRGDTAVTIRLLLRRQGIAGLAAVAGGATALGALTLPWQEVLASVEMLGAASSRREAVATVWPGDLWGWLVALGGLGAIGLGAGVALDRPVRWARVGLAVIAGLVSIAAAVAHLFPPEVAEVAGSVLREWSLPEGVEMERSVRATVGTWVALGSAGMIAIGALGARDT